LNSPASALWLQPVLQFLDHIGIDCRPGKIADAAFLPGVCIDAGAIVFDVESLLAVSDLLHEAGHIAVTPRAHRQALGGALTVEMQYPFGGEIEAIAWSFAAANHIAMPLTELFHPMGYRGHASGLALNFSLGVYPGVYGLIQAGLAAAPQSPEARYPRLLKWLRD
jgi:hypothetical protein